MSITVFVLLFSVGVLALLTALLHSEKISQPVFAAVICVLTVFDYALLSLDKIYYLHKEQDQSHQVAFDQQLAVISQLTQIQLDMTLQLLSQSSAQDSETSIVQKVQWRDALLAQLQAASFTEIQTEKVASTLNQSIHVYLMEQLNKQLIQGLGHRVYREFVRSRPRTQWTDTLFVSDLITYLTEQTLMTDNIAFAIKRIKHFDQTQTLLALTLPKTQSTAKPVAPEKPDESLNSKQSQSIGPVHPTAIPKPDPEHKPTDNPPPLGPVLNVLPVQSMP